MDKIASLTPEIVKITRSKGTEPPHSGQYCHFSEEGTYLCRQCGVALFRTHQQFDSHCGWPSFDDELPGKVLRQPDADGRRTEILCARCLAHLGHVFTGEYLTDKNLRHCVNSLSLEFVPNSTVEDTEEAIFAGGCFWGMQYYFNRLPGVLKTEVGYTGGTLHHPGYRDVCRGDSGHYEATRVVFDPSKLSYENLVRYFFEIHDPTQANGQGPDLGIQYQSAVFYFNSEQQKIIERVMAVLIQKGFKLVTKVLPVQAFWPAEEDHQAYYQKIGKEPYCHAYTKRF